MAAAFEVTDFSSSEDGLLEAEVHEKRRNWPLLARVGALSLLLAGLVAFVAWPQTSKLQSMATNDLTGLDAALLSATVSVGMAGLDSWDANGVVTKVKPDSPADDAGVKADGKWKIVSFSGLPLSTQNVIAAAKKPLYQAYIDGKTEHIDLPVKFEKQGVKNMRLDMVGFTVDPKTQKVTVVVKGSDAEDKGFKVGMIVNSINGKTFKDKKEYDVLIHGAKKAAFENFLAGKSPTIVFKLASK